LVRATAAAAAAAAVVVVVVVVVLVNVFKGAKSSAPSVFQHGSVFSQKAFFFCYMHYFFQHSSQCLLFFRNIFNCSSS
jgi:hypothetical protein